MAYFIPQLKGFLWNVSLIAVFIIMLIRPINDLFPSFKFYKFLTLRKNLGILSSIIVISFAGIHYYNLRGDFLSIYFSLAYWTFKNALFWAHLGELTAFILFITSNRFSVRILKTNWKRIQRLSYVYFFSGSWFVFIAYNQALALMGIIIVFEITLYAFIHKKINNKISNDIISLNSTISNSNINSSISRTF